MKKVYAILFFTVLFLSSCAHGRPQSRDDRVMYYAYRLDDVFIASQTVLKEHEYRAIEINRVDGFIKAVKDMPMPGSHLTVILTFREEGNGTWLKINKRVPPQFKPGSTSGYRMDVDDLFQYVDVELDRNH